MKAFPLFTSLAIDELPGEDGPLCLTAFALGHALILFYLAAHALWAA